MDFNKIESELAKPKKKNWFFNYLTVGFTGGYENEAVRRSLLVNLFTHIALISVLGFFIKEVMADNISYSLILLSFFIICLFIILFLKFSKNFHVSAIMMTILMYMLCTIFVINGGDKSTAILWNYTFPIVAFFSLGKKVGSIYALLAFVTFFVFLFFEPIPIAEYSQPFKVRFISSYVVVNLMLFVFEYIREKTYNALQESNDKKTYYLNQVIQQKEEIITQSEKIEEANKELEKLSIVASKTLNSVVIFDGKGDITWVNDGFTRMNGYTLEEFIKNKGRNIIELSNNPDITSIIKSCFETKKPVSYAICIYNRFNQRIWIQTTLTPILDEKGIIIKLIAIDADVTKVKEAEEEIQQQKEELVAQSELLLLANKTLEKTNRIVTDSINYAQKIQDALFPKIELIKKHFTDVFIFFKPRNIVSGDFYWTTEINNKVLIAVADCTGHGVPGAFMSIIGISLLNQIVKENKILKPSEILEKLDVSLKAVFSQDGKADSQYDDGMDISICVLDKEKKTIEFSSANQTIYLIIDKQIDIVSGDLYSIGESLKGVNLYNNYSFEYKNDASIYMCSDGYQDQFGGPKNKKITEQGIKTLIFEISDLPMSEQYQMIKSHFNQWKGGLKQTDDVMVIGLKFD